MSLNSEEVRSEIEVQLADLKIAMEMRVSSYFHRQTVGELSGEHQRIVDKHGEKTIHELMIWLVENRRGREGLHDLQYLGEIERGNPSLNGNYVGALYSLYYVAIGNLNADG